MCWSATLGDGSKTLIRCATRIDSDIYINILKEEVPNICKDDSIFMHDGASCHQSKKTSEYLDRTNICLLSYWPLQSPDLNSLENLWSILKKNVSRGNPTNKDELWDLILQERNKMSNDVIPYMLMP